MLDSWRGSGPELALKSVPEAPAVPGTHSLMLVFVELPGKAQAVMRQGGIQGRGLRH